MYTLLAFASRIPCNAERVLQRASDVTDRVMPDMGPPRQTVFTHIDEIHGGWFYTRPAETKRQSFIQDHTTASTAVLAIGNVYQDGRRALCQAAAISNAWESGGIDAVRMLDGSFSAVIVDRSQHSVYVVSDLIGRLSLRSFSLDDCFIVSSHDVPIVATGLCPVEIDIVSASSIVALDWSLGGMSLIKPIRVCDPRSYVYWSDGTTTCTHRPQITFDDRITANDETALQSIRQRMVASMQQRVRAITEGEETVRCLLTAGLDSRAVFAVVKSVVTSDRLVTRTAGAPRDLDATMARRIADRYGVQHDRFVPVSPSTDAFRDNCQQWAFFSNGTSNSKRGLRRTLNYNPSTLCLFGGAGGEIYRGYYYRFARRHWTGKVSVDDAVRAVMARFPRFKTLPWRDPALADAVSYRLVNALQTCSRLSDNGYDVLDLFYLFERFGRWSLGQRVPNSEHSFTPFETIPLILDAFRLPAPIGVHCLLHKETIRRLLPETYWWPLNGGQWIGLEGHRVAQTLQVGIVGLRRRSKRVLARWISSHRAVGDSKSVDQLQAEAFSQVLTGEEGERIATDGGFGAEMFGKANIRAMIEQKPLTMQGLQVLGFLVTLEYWKSQVKRSRELAVMAMR